MKWLVVLVFFLCLFPVSVRATETATNVIKQVDKNQVFVTQEFKATMIIAKGKRKLIKTFYGYSKKEGQKSFMEFTNPEDKGVRYLKIDDELWIYFPDADDSIKISGHMLRQGLMGSDISYEDMLQNDSVEEKYNCRLLPDKKVTGRECYVVELVAKKPNVTYKKQIIVVDKAWFVPLEIEMYARGGRLLKRMSQTKIKKIGARWVPMIIKIKDMRKRDSETTVIFTEVIFDKKLPKKVFTRGYLRR